MKSKKTISIIIDKKSELENFLFSNLYEVFGDEVCLNFYYISDMKKIKDSDLVLVMIKERILSILPYIIDTSKVLSVKRTLMKRDFDSLMKLQSFDEVLVVNDTLETTMDLITSIYNIGIKNVRLVPYISNMNTDNFKFCITANESHLMPKEVDYFDIGYRPMDISTIIEVISRLNLNISDYITSLEKYNSKYISQEKKTLENLRLSKTVTKLSHALKQKISKSGFFAEHYFEDIHTNSAELKQTILKAKKLSLHDINILIYGETGTGKELFAQAIHNNSPRSNFPFIGINVTAIPSNLLESELFGYTEGSFTGSKRGGHTGIFEKCNGGTLFLDEIGDMPLELQTKLLRAIEEKKILPIGANEFIKFDVRIIAATNKNLKEEIENGNFRKDLYYRLKSSILNLTPLRDRLIDLKDMMCFFLERDSIHMTPAAENILLNYSWDGNIRELKNTCNYINIMDSDGLIDVDDIPDDLYSSTDNSNMGFDAILDLIHLNKEKIKLVLLAINRLSLENSSAGRYSVKAYLDKQQKVFSDSELKNIFKELNSKGIIKQSRGRKGALLTSTGYKLLDFLATSK